MGERIRQRDWSETVLGPRQGWPQALKNALSIVLPSTFPMFVWWGPERIVLYNDAYIPLVGAKHPGHLGARAHEEWAEIWDVVGPLADEVFTKGRAVGSDHLPLIMHRYGFPEEAYFGFSYSPITGDDGAIAGLFCACHETTAEVLRLRRLQLLQGLGIGASELTVAEAGRRLVQALGRGPQDLPFVLLYLTEPSTVEARSEATSEAVSEVTLLAAAGLEAGGPLSPQRLPLGTSPSPWPLAAAWQGKAPFLRVEGFGPLLVQGPTGEAFNPVEPLAETACVVPIALPSEPLPLGFLILGLSPRRPFDEEYEAFVRLVSSQVASSLEVARNRESEKRRLEDLHRYAEWSERDRAQLEAVFQSVTDGIVVANTTGDLLLVNEAEARIAGFSDPDAMKQNISAFVQWFEFWEEGGRKLAPEEWPLARILRGETLSNLELRGRRIDTGQEWCFSFSGSPVRDAQGEQALGVVITRDISAAKRAEEALRRSEAHFRRLVDTAPVMLWITDEKGACTYISPQWYGFTGGDAAQDEDLGFGWLEKVHPDDQERTRRIFLEANEQRTPFSFDYRVRGRDGQYRWAVDFGNPRFDEQGRFGGYVGAVLDLSERKQMEAALAESEALFRDMANALPLLTWMAEPRGGIFWYNQRWYDYTGTTLEECAGWGWTKVHHPDHLERVLQKVYRAAETGELWEDTFPLRSHRGEWRWFLSRALPLRNAEGAIVRWFGSGTDVTDEMRARDELAKALQARDDFLSIASHELRTPLASLKLQAQLMKRGIAHNDPRIFEPTRVRRLAEEADRQTDRLSRLVDDMLDISRIRTGRLSLRPELLALDQLVLEVVERLRPQLAATGTRLELSIHEGVQGYWDRLRLEQVLINLLTNAQRYGERKPVTVSLDQEDGLARLSVRDQGIGIPRDMRERIFERFERGSSAKEVSGLGLGLFITREIVEAHGGRIWVESEGHGRGAQFTVELPVELHQKGPNG